MHFHYKLLTIIIILLKTFFFYRFLTKREQQLIKRRKNAEDLLAWNQRLDQEEKEVAAIERKALAKWERQKAATSGDVTTPTKTKEGEKKVTSPSSVSKSTGKEGVCQSVRMLF